MYLFTFFLFLYVSYLWTDLDFLKKKKKVLFWFAERIAVHFGSHSISSASALGNFQTHFQDGC